MPVAAARAAERAPAGGGERQTPPPARGPERARHAVTLATPALVAHPLLLIGGVALAGGFADVPRERLPVLALGERYDNGLYAVSVRSVAVVDRDPVSGTASRGPEVVADVDLLYRGDEPATGAPRWLRPLDVGITEAAASATSPRSVRNDLAEPVQPGLPVRTRYRWPLPAGSAVRPGAAVRLGVYERYEVDAAIEGVTTGSVLVAVFQRDGR